MDVRLRVIVEVYPGEVPRVRFDPHGDPGALVRLNDEDIVQLAFESERHLRLWAASIVDCVDRKFGSPAEAPKHTDEPDPAPAGAAQLCYGKGD